MQDSITHEALEALTNPREVLEAAWNKLHDHQKAPWQKLAVGDGMERFRRFLDAEAYTDAALMLVPEGARVSLSNIVSPGYFAFVSYMDRPGEGSTRDDHPALAIAQAALKTQEPPHADR